MAKNEPSETQMKVLVHMAASSEPIRRTAGGFWSLPDDWKPGADAPEWSVDIRTIRAMEDRGWLRRLNVHVEEWRDHRALTEAGRDLVAGAAIETQKDWT